MTFDDSREHFLSIRDHVKQAHNILTDADSYDEDIASELKKIIEKLNTKIGEVTFK